MFYVVHSEYAGPNQNQEAYADLSTIEIRTEPARTNMSREIRLEGWCGTTNDFSVRAYGEYSTLEAAREAIAEKFGAVRDRDPEGSKFEPESGDDAVAEIYKPGRYAPLVGEGLSNWICPGIEEDIGASTPRSRFSTLIDDYLDQVNDEGYTFDRSRVEKMLEDRRDYLRDVEGWPTDYEDGQTLIQIEDGVSDETLEKIRQHLDTEAIQNPDWNGAEFRIMRGSFTSIESHEDAINGAILLNSIQKIIQSNPENQEGVSFDQQMNEGRPSSSGPGVG